MVRRALLAGALALLPLAAHAAAAAGTQDAAAARREAAVAGIMARAARDPGELRLLLHRLPKGGDLHNHITGALFAEDMIGWAGDKGLCVADDATGFVAPPCRPGSAVADVARQDPPRYGRLVDALSTRGWQAGVGSQATSGHDQFFATFGRFEAATEGRDAAAMVAVRRQAAQEGVLYLELDHNPPALLGAALGGGDSGQPLDAAGLAAFHAREAARLAALVPAMRAEIDAQEAEARRIMACDTPRAEPACAVTVRYLGWALRSEPPAAVFRALILAFELAARDPRFVGVNIVAPEDWPVARADYGLHMAMFRFLGARHPQVALSLHAGELGFGMVPPADLRDHIGAAVAAGAQRIGHGVDIAYEDEGAATLVRMARTHVAVEINLTSNAVILGIAGKAHPLALYRRHGVPVVLATDDQGVLRTDLTREYQRAVEEHGLGYADLKALSRASLEFAFLAGDSLWADRVPGRWVPACAGGALGAPACRAVIAGSDKARLQAELERRLVRFEAGVLAAPG